MKYHSSFTVKIGLLSFLVIGSLLLFINKNLCAVNAAQDYYGEVVAKKDTANLEQYYFLLKKVDVSGEKRNVDSSLIIALNDFSFHIRGNFVYWFSTGGMYTTIPVLNRFIIKDDKLVSDKTLVLDEFTGKCSCQFTDVNAIVTCNNKKVVIDLQKFEIEDR